MKKVTVFTPTYNRAYLLPRLYESLCRQTSRDFLWMVIDDGSTDNTKQFIEQWQAENKIEIQYFYKENGGMHTGHNLAYQNIRTELNVCIDSDDWMPDDAVEKILNFWSQLENKEEFSGFVGLDADVNGRIIGTAIDKNLKRGSYLDLYRHTTGDKKFVLKTEEVKKYPPYPEFQNEKLSPLGALYILMGEEKDFLFVNEVYCIVEYQPEGSGNTIFRQYKQSPRGFAWSRKIQIKYSIDIISKFKNYVHLVSSAIFAKDFKIAFQGVNPLFSLLVAPFGVLLNLFIRLKI